MTTQTETRFTAAIALVKSLTLDTDKLSAVLDIVIPEEERKILWKDVRQDEEFTNATLTPLHVIIFAYSQTGFRTEVKRDAAYLLCIKQIIGSSDDDLSIYFKWYVKIPREKFMVSEKLL